MVSPSRRSCESQESRSRQGSSSCPLFKPGASFAHLPIYGLEDPKDAVFRTLFHKYLGVYRTCYGIRTQAPDLPHARRHKGGTEKTGNGRSSSNCSYLCGHRLWGIFIFLL